MTVQRDARRDAGEEGFTLVELMVATAIAMVIMAISMAVLVVAQREVKTTVSRASDTDMAEQALTRIENTVRFATGVEVSTDGTQLWVYNTNNPASSACGEWDYDSSAGKLYWSVGAAGGSQGTAGPVAAGVFQTQGGHAALPVFSAPTSGFSGLVDISFSVLQSAASSQSAKGTAVTDSVTDRNMTSAVTTSSTPSSICP